MRGVVADSWAVQGRDDGPVADMRGVIESVYVHKYIMRPVFIREESFHVVSLRVVRERIGCVNL